ncbi:hypothetical protein ACC678_37340, partial [Rhizobium ruizarguesonis]
EWQAVEEVRPYSISGTSGARLYASIGERGPEASGFGRAIAHFRIFDSEGNVVTRPRHTSMAAADRVTKGDYDHFMEKEIYEKPEV